MIRMPKLSLTKLWMMSHPNDTPPPKSPAAAAAWRRKRFVTRQYDTEHEKYEELMAETRRLAESHQ
jgi:hypothetical protein